MRKGLLKILSVVTVLTLSFGVFNCAPYVSAQTDAERRQEINNQINKLTEQKNKINKDIKNLENDIKKQNELKSAIEKKIALVQREIDLCNEQINLVNSKIAKNKAEIEKKNQQIEADKLSFKKRLRAIYMSNSDSNVQILLGADDFSQFLQLSQLTASVSAHDKLMIEKIVATVKDLEAKQQENNKLLEEQKAIKAKTKSKQDELVAEGNKIGKVISSIQSDKKDAQDDLKEKENALKIQRQELARINAALSGGSNVIYDGGLFAWPVSGSNPGQISSRFRTASRPTHDGIDIAFGGCAGRSVIAISSGEVIKVVTGCPHNYGKGNNYRWDTCGGGYGNYVIVDHGKGPDGKVYKAWYAHLGTVRVSVGQKVSKGQTLGTLGSTGYSTGWHLHFGVQVGKNVNNKFVGDWVNPENFYRKVK